MSQFQSTKKNGKSFERKIFEKAKDKIRPI